MPLVDMKMPDEMRSWLMILQRLRRTDHVAIMVVIPDPLVHMNVFCLVTREPPSLLLVVRFKLGVTVLSVLIRMNVKDAYNLLHTFALPQLVERDLRVKLLQFVQVGVVFFELAIEFERLGFPTRLRMRLFLQ